MRIWDVNPGYLNRQSLLGEHREIHGLFSVIHHQKKGYSHHPETLRWYGKMTALKRRHDLLVSEMLLRGYQHRSPMPEGNGEQIQTQYVDLPYQQFKILEKKYENREPGRIPLPVNCQQLWAQHKYSVMARDPAFYRKIGPLVSKNNNEELFNRLSQEFVEILLIPPSHGRLVNALLHMWGYVSRYISQPHRAQLETDLKSLANTLCHLVFKHQATYLMHSTALNDLMVYV
ncbi:MAG: DUF1722 domain-containing protein [Candidatus Aminicenantes bacterium]|nr:DUF1722 domain-containing protein [Candidatus Aminicenantes bacterium]NIM80461.1 DUF1722 domain-containing protein [Candidatus Aminicenantes bacterium]NIN19854.1 DUF1722 domain-containing protein [Candidatus Aminicenantes bacterium]NIN43730.1 DUF1722 domain-containing protein [Candidatus Aminicenantes bacterium]NIN86480.1 DUF1722 domain-containing protein [Candidatus Aminicenantes bacterium]